MWGGIDTDWPLTDVTDLHPSSIALAFERATLAVLVIDPADQWTEAVPDSWHSYR